MTLSQSLVLEPTLGSAHPHEPVREGTFPLADRHERDRRAKFGKHDEVGAAEPQPKAKKQAKRPASSDESASETPK